MFANKLYYDNLICPVKQYSKVGWRHVNKFKFENKGVAHMP